MLIDLCAWYFVQVFSACIVAPSSFSLPTSASARVNVKKLRQDLSLTLEGDWRIVLAAADKLKPGIYQLVLGEKYDSEYLPNMADVL